MCLHCGEELSEFLNEIVLILLGGEAMMRRIEAIGNRTVLLARTWARLGFPAEALMKKLAHLNFQASEACSLHCGGTAKGHGRSSASMAHLQSHLRRIKETVCASFVKAKATEIPRPETPKPETLSVINSTVSP